jgi:hypothetical protein
MTQHIEMLSKSESHFERVKAAKQIALLESPNKDMIEILVQLMRDDTIAVRLTVAKVFKTLGKKATGSIEAINTRMKEIEGDVYFGDPHFLDTTSEAGAEFHALQEVLDSL